MISAKSTQERKCMTRLRVSCHIFPLEDFWYRKPQNRNCTICTADKIGEHQHPFFNCSNENILNETLSWLTNHTNFVGFDKGCIIDYCILIRGLSLATSKPNNFVNVYLRLFAKYWTKLQKRKRIYMKICPLFLPTRCTTMQRYNTSLRHQSPSTEWLERILINLYI